MRRKDREMPGDFALKVADKCAFAVMATINADGSPYCIPLSIVREGEWIYFHCAKEGRKIDNLRCQNRVCISCVGDVKAKDGEFSLEFESAVISGTAAEVQDHEERIRALRLIGERYTPHLMAAFDGAIEKNLESTGVWKIHIDEISGKKRA